MLLLMSLVTTLTRMLLLLGGDIERNPGPGGKKTASKRTGRRTKKEAKPAPARCKRSYPAEPAPVRRRRSYPDVERTVRDESIAHCVFREHQPILLKLFESNLIELAHHLCAKELITNLSRDQALQTKGLCQSEQASILVRAVETTIDSSSNSDQIFRELCSVMKEFPSTPMLAWAKQLMQEFEQQCARRDTENDTKLDTSEKTSDKSSKSKKRLLPSKSFPTGLHSTTYQPMKRFQEYLKATYHKKFPPYNKPPSIYLGPKNVVDLALMRRSLECWDTREESMKMQVGGDIDTLVSSKPTIDLTNIGFIHSGGEKEPTQHILIEGAPGMGKTTLAWHMCHMWERGELLQKWDTVVMLQLREKQIRQAKTLADLLYHPDPNLQWQFLTEIELKHGNELMLICDGFDEVCFDQLEEDGVLMKLLNGHILPLATIVITSRPFATSHLPGSFADSRDLQHIEVVGFTKKNVDTYIEASCDGSPLAMLNAFRTYLSGNPFIRSCMHNPLLCAIITQLYISHWNGKESGFVPRTLTQVYTYLVKSLLGRDRLRRKTEITPESLVDCGPVTNISKDDREMLLDIAELAARGIENRQYIFDHVTCESMGFLRKVEGIYTENEHADTYSFLHLTLQEFLSALYWCYKLSSNEINKLITRSDLFPIQEFVKEKNLEEAQIGHSTVTSHWPVLLFIAGIKKFKTLQQLEESTKSKSLQIMYPSVCRLLFECQCTEVVFQTLKGGMYIIYPNCFKSKLDWFVAGYSIAHSHSSCLWTIFVNRNDEFQALTEGLHYCKSTSECGKIDHLCIRNPSDLFSLHPYTKQLTKLTLSGRPSDCNLFSQIPSYFPFLSSIHLGDSQSTLSQYWEMVVFLPKLKHLEKIQISFKDTDLQKDRFIDQLHHCSALKQLVICGSQSGTSLSSLPTNLASVLDCKLQHLELHHMFIHREDASAISCALQSRQCKLHMLGLVECEFYKFTVAQVAEGIERNSSLCRISFDGSQMESFSEVFSLVHAMERNARVEEFSFRDQRDIPSDVLQALVQSLSRDTKLCLALDKLHQKTIEESAFPFERVKFL